MNTVNPTNQANQTTRHGNLESLPLLSHRLSEGVRAVRPCNCFFCSKKLEHPARHDKFEEISHRLLVSESLDPAHSIRMEACVLCGHRKEKKDV